MDSEKNLMVRLKTRDKEYLQQLARLKGESMTRVIEELLEDHRRRSFFEGLTADYAALRKNTQSWQDEVQEQLLWDSTASDGLEHE